MRSVVSATGLILASFSMAATSFAADDVAVTTLSRSAIVEQPGNVPAAGALVSGQPDQQVLEVIADAGFVAVVDLRLPGENRGMDERHEVESRGMQYFSLPVAAPAGITSENARKLDEIVDSIDGPVLLHCGSGNRVGALFALSARDAGASVEEAMATGKAAGLTRLADKVESLLKQE